MKEGDIIRSILVKDIDDKEINLMSLYHGKTLLIIIYNNQCLGCTGRGIPLAYEFHKAYDLLQVVGIHTDFGPHQTTIEELKTIFTAADLPFPIYRDHKATVFHQFKSEGTPQWLIIRSNGKLYRSFFGSLVGSHMRIAYALESLL